MANALKTATKRVVQDLGGLAAAASCTRVGQSQLADYGSIEKPDKLIPVDVALDLEQVAGAPHITRALAAALRQELLPLPSGKPRHELAACLAGISDDNGKLFCEVSKAIKGQPLNKADRARMKRELGDVVAWAREALCVLREDEE